MRSLGCALVQHAVSLRGGEAWARCPTQEEEEEARTQGEDSQAPGAKERTWHTPEAGRVGRAPLSRSRRPCPHLDCGLRPPASPWAAPGHWHSCGPWSAQSPRLGCPQAHFWCSPPPAPPAPAGFSGPSPLPTCPPSKPLSLLAGAGGSGEKGSESERRLFWEVASDVDLASHRVLSTACHLTLLPAPCVRWGSSALASCHEGPMREHTWVGDKECDPWAGPNPWGPGLSGPPWPHPPTFQR